MSKHTLLLADDSITIQKVVNLTFADEGIEVISVGDGNAALEKLAEFTPDLVMADINMPGLSGYEICQRIRQNEATQQTPVILLVGAFEPFDEDEARRVGANDFLTKPFQSIRQLVTKVTGLLEASAIQEKSVDTPTTDLSQTNEAPRDEDLVDTLKMEKQSIGQEEFDDSGFDDEMIETNQISSESEPDSNYFTEAVANTQGSSAQVEYIQGDEALRESSIETDVSDAEEAIEASEERGYAFVGEMPASPGSSSHEDVASVAEQPIDNFSSNMEMYPQADSFDEPDFPIALDEGNLLELPPTENVAPHSEPATQWKVAEASATSTTFESVAKSPIVTDDSKNEEMQIKEVNNDSSSIENLNEPVNEESTEVSENEGIEEEISVPETVNLPPQVIKVIAEKVSERFSEEVIREIVAEITPKITELIAKRIAEDK